MDGPASIIFDQAENRLTAMRGILVYLLYQNKKPENKDAQAEEMQKLQAQLESLFPNAHI